jgi:porphobilinogen synthase
MLRDLVRETALDVRDLVYPMFVVPGRGVSRPVTSMPGVCQLSVDRAVVEAREVRALGIRDHLFGGSGGDSSAKRTIRGWPPSRCARSESVPDPCVITDARLAVPDHRHRRAAGEGRQRPTLEVLAREAVCHARAGARGGAF